MKKVMQLLSLNLLVLMLVAGCTGTGQNLGFGEGNPNEELYKSLLKKDGCKKQTIEEFANYLDPNDQLAWACSQGYPKLVEQLLQEGTDVNHRSGPEGYTPLLRLAVDCNDSIGAVCCGIPFNQKQKRGNPNADYKRYSNVVRTLLAYEADVFIVPTSGPYEGLSALEILQSRDKPLGTLSCHFSKNVLDKHVKDIALKNLSEQKKMEAAKKEKETEKETENLETAKRMLRKGMDISDIADVTGLSVAEVIDLKSELEL